MKKNTYALDLASTGTAVGLTFSLLGVVVSVFFLSLLSAVVPLLEGAGVTGAWGSFFSFAGSSGFAGTSVEAGLVSVELVLSVGLVSLFLVDVSFLSCVPFVAVAAVVLFLSESSFGTTAGFTALVVSVCSGFVSGVFASVALAFCGGTTGVCDAVSRS